MIAPLPLLTFTQSPSATPDVTSIDRKCGRFKCGYAHVPSDHASLSIAYGQSGASDNTPTTAGPENRWTATSPSSPHWRPGVRREPSAALLQPQDGRHPPQIRPRAESPLPHGALRPRRHPQHDGLPARAQAPHRRIAGGDRRARGPQLGRVRHPARPRPRHRLRGRRRFPLLGPGARRFGHGPDGRGRSRPRHRGLRPPGGRRRPGDPAPRRHPRLQHPEEVRRRVRERELRLHGPRAALPGGGGGPEAGRLVRHPGTLHMPPRVDRVHRRLLQDPARHPHRVHHRRRGRRLRAGAGRGRHRPGRRVLGAVHGVEHRRARRRRALRDPVGLEPRKAPGVDHHPRQAVPDLAGPRAGDPAAAVPSGRGS